MLLDNESAFSNTRQEGNLWRVSASFKVFNDIRATTEQLVPKLTLLFYHFLGRLKHSPCKKYRAYFGKISVLENSVISSWVWLKHSSPKDANRAEDLFFFFIRWVIFLLITLVAKYDPWWVCLSSSSAIYHRVLLACTMTLAKWHYTHTHAQLFLVRAVCSLICAL